MRNKCMLLRIERDTANGALSSVSNALKAATDALSVSNSALHDSNDALRSRDLDVERLEIRM